jgi:hypothetical protein
VGIRAFLVDRNRFCDVRDKAANRTVDAASRCIPLPAPSEAVPLGGVDREQGMALWLNAIGYQVVWFCAVIGAGGGRWWPALLAASVFVAWQWAVSRQRAADLRLVAAALACGLAIDGALAASGLARYAAAWPWPAFAPAWILAVWAAFAMTLNHSMRWMQPRPWAAALLGAVGGPLAYLGAARGWDAVAFAPPQWPALLALAALWLLAMPLLAGLARYWSGDGRDRVRLPQT